MPEYLSPGVYVEEVSTGSKPIEGVSTSTSGMVGMTERGPENVPVLVTSQGEYRRIFGGELDLLEFTDGVGRVHGYLPNAVDGFFQNGGQRNYAVRVLPNAAAAASRTLFDRGGATAVETTLLRTASQGSGTAVNLPLAYVLDPGSLTSGDWVRIGTGSRAEYRTLAANPSGTAVHVALGAPLARSYPAGTDIFPVASGSIAYDLDPFTVNEPDGLLAGATVIHLTEGTAGDAVALAGMADVILEIGATATAEYLNIRSMTAAGGELEVVLASPLLGDLANGVPVQVINNAGMIAAAPGTIPTLESSANAGDILAYTADAATFSSGDVAVIGDTAGTAFEIRRVGQLGFLTVDAGAYDTYPSTSAVQLVTLTDEGATISAGTSSTEFDLGAAGAVEPGMTIEIEGNADLMTVQSLAGNTVNLTNALAIGTPAGGEAVAIATALTAAVTAGSVVLPVANRVGLQPGNVIRLGNSPDDEYLSILRISGERGVPPDAGTLVVSTGIRGNYDANTRVYLQQTPLADPARPATSLVLGASADEIDLLVSDQTGFSADEVIRIQTPGGLITYHRLTGSTAANNASTIQFDAALEFSHELGTELAQRDPLIDVVALDRGSWGNRLQVAVEDMKTSLVRAQLSAINPPLVISLSNYTGVEAGSVIELLDPTTGETIDEPLKVLRLDRAAGEILLDGTGLTGTHIAAHNNAQMAGTRLGVRSRELLISVFLLQRPDPAVPSRNTTVIDRESFVVTMDPRHSRYIHKVIGTTWLPGSANDDDGNRLRRWDNRSDGESNYIRVRDLAAGDTTTLESVRLGPEALVDLLDSGQIRPARLPLSGGDNALTTLISEAQGDQIYQGLDSDEPRERTGIHVLKNIQEISIAAVPGQFTTAVQQALINHCENDRYRFAVLDASGPDEDTLADVQAQRQNFDTKYAALYHPWLTVTETMPANPANNTPRIIPPSGHMIGIYARTDNTRGVHKAPANEVVRGIIGLTRALNKGEHDILNPFPVNINVIRDFRDVNRGLRVWGARCITSDSEYKYVNVRRLMIFLESSIDRGLQWVVFEPNAEPLWARVRRSITNFLNVVWRNGALEGTTPEQAFFVRCDRTTMTQTDIDSGRLICEIGVAPVKPAEFVIVRIGLWTASAD